MLRVEDYEPELWMQQENFEPVPAQNENFKNFIVRYNQNVHGPVDYVSGGTFQIIDDLFAVLYVPSETQPDMEITSFSYNSIPKCYTHMDLESLNTSGVTKLHNHPYLKLRGQGTAVAIIDSGVDYENPVFKTSNGSKIQCIWDQTVPGKQSEEVPFGKLYTKNEIDEALESENPLSLVPSTDTNGHGTMLAATAAGNTVPEENFSGAAPEASLIVIKLKPAKQYLREFYLYPADAEVYQEDDMMLAIAFAMRFAEKLQMPLSICLGLGTSQGSHQGFSPLSQFIDSVAGFSQNAVSVAAGNEGAARHHYQGTLETRYPMETVELRIGEKEEGFTMEFWGESPESYELSVQSPTGEVLKISSDLRSGTQELSFVFVETKVLVNYIPIERQSGNTLVYFRFFHPAAGIWKIHIQGNGSNHSRFFLWLPVQGLISEDTFFLQSDPFYTITSPGDASGGMTATAYQAKDNSLYLQASRGFTPSEGVKPNFAVPGVEIRVPLLSGGYGTASGTSLSAAQTAGIAALLFEWAIIRQNEPFFTGNSVKNYLQRGAIREEEVSYPNPEWGYGRVDLYHTFELIT